MWIEILNIVGGLILCMGILGAIPAIGKELEKLAKWLGSFQTTIGIIAIILAIFWWSGLQSVMAIIVGLILIVGILPAIPAMGKELEKLAKWLGSFQTIIGIIAIILAIRWWSGLQSIIAIIVGLMLIVGILPAIPAMGKHLEKLAKWLGSFQTFIGIIAIIIGIWGLL
jgi:uncharacterized membrane protein HdeD (DUF308 family)